MHESLNRCLIAIAAATDWIPISLALALAVSLPLFCFAFFSTASRGLAGKEKGGIALASPEREWEEVRKSKIMIKSCSPEEEVGPAATLQQQQQQQQPLAVLNEHFLNWLRLQLWQQERQQQLVIFCITQASLECAAWLSGKCAEILDVL